MHTCVHGIPPRIQYLHADIVLNGVRKDKENMQYAEIWTKKEKIMVGSSVVQVFPDPAMCNSTLNLDSVECSGPPSVMPGRYAL